MSRPARDARPGRVALLVPVSIAFALGIVADRFGVGWPTRIWAEIAGIAAVFALVIRNRHVGFVATVVAMAAIGGAHHHRSWSDLEPDDLALGDWTLPRPAWVRGVVVEVPHFYPDEHADGEGRTQTVLEIVGISNGSRWEAASGRVNLSISGNRADLRAGESVFAAGTLGAIAGPRNPGEADLRDRLRAEGIRLRMAVGEASGVWTDPDGSPRVFLKWLGRARSESYRRLVEKMDPKVAPLAAALLLGRREAVDPNVNDAFARTGTTHLLAISGLQLQAMALALGLALRPFFSGYKKVLVMVAVATVAYAGLVGFMPSVVRAMTMTVAFCLAGLCDRCARPSNLLAIAALVTLMINPAFLFDAGCQLSFLCVATLFWLADPALHSLGLRLANPAFGIDAMRAASQDPEDPIAALDALERRFEPSWKKFSRRCGKWLLRGLVASAVIWLATLPLTALRFHLASPIAILMNLPLIPLTTFALIAAGLSLLFSSAWTPFGWICSTLLGWTDSLVRWGAGVPGGHAFVAGPSWGWVVGFYALLAMAAWASCAGWRPRRWLWAALAVESALAVVAAMQASIPETLEAEILAVDHGLCVAIRSEAGATWLYDCGKMRDPHVGRRLIAPYLWSKGIRRIDGVILSHADADHFDGLPDLLDRFSVGEVLIPDGFGGSANPDATKLLDLVRSRGIPVNMLVAGDRIDFGAGNLGKVLHPARGWLPGARDNDRSIVMDVSDPRDHHLLLTGDLEGAGLPELLAMPRRPIDVLLSPHHGGRAANPDRLYAWAKPGRVIVSQRRPAATTRDALTMQQARGLTVDRTWRDGAVLVRFGPGGLKIAGFLESRPSIRPALSFGHMGWRVLISLLGILSGGGLCLALAVVEWGAWTLVVPGRRLAVPDPELPPWEPIRVRTGDGVLLSGAWLGANRPGAASAVLIHGFGEDRSALAGRAALLAGLGLNVAVLDARGRGRSDGDRTSFGGRETGDLRQWLDVLALRTGPDPRFVAWGRSMGAAVALRAASEDSRIIALILEAPYADLREAVAATLRRMRISGRFAGLMLRRAGKLAGVSLHKPAPVDVAALVTVPVLILHGHEDPLVSPAEARRLAGACAGPTEIIEVPEAGHHNVFEEGGEPLRGQISAWLESPDRPASNP